MKKMTRLETLQFALRTLNELPSKELVSLSSACTPFDLVRKGIVDCRFSIGALLGLKAQGLAARRNVNGSWVEERQGRQIGSFWAMAYSNLDYDTCDELSEIAYRIGREHRYTDHIQCDRRSLYKKLRLYVIYQLAKAAR